MLDPPGGLAVLMFHGGGIQQQVFQRPKAEIVFRPWWDFIEEGRAEYLIAVAFFIKTVQN